MKKVDIGRIYPHKFPQTHFTDKDIVDCSILDTPKLLENKPVPIATKLKAESLKSAAHMDLKLPPKPGMPLFSTIHIIS